MGGHRIINQNEMHFLTFTVVDWVDVFTRKVYKDILIESLDYCIKKKGLLLFSYVIMSNHMHLIIRTESKDGLSAIVRDFKKFTAKKIITQIKESHKESRKTWMLEIFIRNAKKNSNNSEYQFWTHHNKPIELVSPKWINQKLDYIHLNPVRAGLVIEPKDYLYSSATNYVGIGGLLDVEILDFFNDIGYIDIG